VAWLHCDCVVCGTCSFVDVFVLIFLEGIFLEGIHQCVHGCDGHGSSIIASGSHFTHTPLTNTHTCKRMLPRTHTLAHTQHTQGMDVHLVGEANDYVGKSMSGGDISIVPPPNSGFQVGVHLARQM